MGSKATWKRAPREQRRLAPGRTPPKARFTRGQSGALPPLLPGRQRSLNARPLLIVGALLVMVGLGVALVIAVGAYIQAEQHFDDMEQRAAYYGRPTQPFATAFPTRAPTQPALAETDAQGETTLQATALPERISGEVIPATEGALTEPDDASGGVKLLSSSCPDFGIPQSVRIFDWNDWSTVEVNNPLIAQLPLHWDATENLWRGYDAPKRFDTPVDERERWQLHFTSTSGDERWINMWTSALTPDTYYAYVFQVITPFAVENGQHFGYHPCRTFAVPVMQMDVLLSSARAYRSSGSHFPSLAGADDSHWTAASIAPLGSLFDLRASPTLVNNDPVKTVAETVSGSVITDPDWGVWAQVKLGDTIAWVDTSTVSIGAAP